jgi:hypothetical protein
MQFRVGLVTCAVLVFIATFAAGRSLASESAQTNDVTWHDITLGMPTADLRSRLGDPLRTVAFENGRSVSRYWVPRTDALIFVLRERGYVTGFRAAVEQAPAEPLTSVPPDPSGIRLGDSLDRVKTVHPDFHAGTDADGMPTLSGRASANAGVVYDFDQNRVNGFQWGTQLAANQPSLPDGVQPSGASEADAILDAQNNETDGVRWEYVYLSYHPCDGKTQWVLANQALAHDNRRAYDRLHVVCPTTKVQRDFFFDISSYFGKL